MNKEKIGAILSKLNGSLLNRQEIVLAGGGFIAIWLI